MNKILCSTGAITGNVNNYNYRLLEPLSKQLLCDGYEFMMDRPWHEDIETLKDFLFPRAMSQVPCLHEHLANAARV